MLTVANSMSVNTTASGPGITSTAALFGISGTATGNSGAGFLGAGKDTSVGVVGNGVSADGVKGLSTNGSGVDGDTAASGTSGVYGQASNSGGYGVYGRNSAGGYRMATDEPAFQRVHRAAGLRRTRMWVEMVLATPFCVALIRNCLGSRPATLRADLRWLILRPGTTRSTLVFESVTDSSSPHHI
jgi:hypothetical protein